MDSLFEPDSRRFVRAFSAEWGIHTPGFACGPSVHQGEVGFCDAVRLHLAAKRPGGAACFGNKGQPAGFPIKSVDERDLSAGDTFVGEQVAQPMPKRGTVAGFARVGGHQRWLVHDQPLFRLGHNHRIPLGTQTGGGFGGDGRVHGSNSEGHELKGGGGIRSARNKSRPVLVFSGERGKQICGAKERVLGLEKACFARRPLPRYNSSMSWLVHSERFSLPPVVPVMLLNQAQLFPHTLMPLYIFEPRYREMLQFALERERMWIIGCLKDEEGEGFENIHSVAGLGMIRACVQNMDDTAHLVMQGIQRVRIQSLDMEGSFPLARVEVLESVSGPPDTLEVLSARLLTCVAKHKAAGGQLPKQFEQQLSSIESPEIVADIVSAALVTDAPLRQALLEQADVSKRLEQLLEWFE